MNSYIYKYMSLLFKKINSLKLNSFDIISGQGCYRYASFNVREKDLGSY